METIVKAAVRSGSTGAPLPPVYSCLERKLTKFRRAGTCMLAGPPGAFKSTLALNLVVSWASRGLAGLYISADSDAFTVGKRCAAIITGDDQQKVEKTIRTGQYAEPLKMLDNVHWEFRPLNMKQLDLRMRAFEQMYGRFPDFVVIDNLMNCVEGPGDWNGQLMMTRDLDTLSRASLSHILILHHSQENKDGSNTGRPPARWEIQGKVNQFPRLILTVNAIGPHMMLATVKNTNGPQDPTGNDYEDFMIQTGNCRIEEVELG